MSEDYLAQQQPTLTWNSVRGVWEKAGMANLLCEHWELFSATWQTSGMMRNGQVFELPTQARLTTDSESLSSPILRTPTASQGEGGALGEEEARKRGNTVGIRDNALDLAKLNGLPVSRVVDNLMPTPNTMDHLPARTPEQKAANKGKGGYANVRETVVNDLIPTPTTRDYKDGSEPHERDGVVQTDTVARAVFNSGEVLLPITRTSMKNGATAKEVAAGNPKFRIEAEVLLMPTPDAYAATRGGSSSPEYKKSRGSMVTLQDETEKGTNWGKFEPAIRRWEETLGRPAPAPTKPDGKDGAHRLSSAFTEWMMGVPEGWITGVGLSRNDELKACGNGVVPQQAELALRVLLEGITLPRGGGK
jgi:hypothetical protein